MDSSPSNGFDEITTGFDVKESRKQDATNRINGERLDQLIHKVFKQSEDGAELLSIWIEKGLIMAPTARAGDDLLTIGLEEGKKEFIRKIKITIEKVEKND